MGGEEDGTSLGTLLGLFRNPTNEPAPRAAPTRPLTPNKAFLSGPTSPGTNQVTSKILDELRFRNVPTYETEKLPRRRTIHFGKFPGPFRQPTESSIKEVEEDASAGVSVLSPSSISPSLSPIPQASGHPWVEEGAPPSWVKEIQGLRGEVDRLMEEKHQQKTSFDKREYSYREEIAAVQEQRDRILEKYEADQLATRREIDHCKEEMAWLQEALTQALISLDAKVRSDSYLLQVDTEKQMLRESVKSLEEEKVEKSLRRRDVEHAEEIENLEREKWDLEDQLNDTKSQLRSHGNSLNKMAVQLSESRDRLESLEVEKKDLEIRAVENEIAYLDLEEERDELRSRCDRLEKQLTVYSELTNETVLERLTNKRDSLRQQCTELNQEIDQFHKKVTAAVEEKSRLAKELSEIMADANSLESRVKSAREEYSKTSLQLAEQSELFSTQIRDRRAEEESLRTEVEALEAQHESLERHYDSLQKSIEELNEVLSQEAERIDSLHEDRRTLEEEIDVLVEVNEELRSKVEFWRNSVQEVETELTKSAGPGSRHASRSLNAPTFARIQKIYEQRLADQEQRFNRLWDDIVISNEHLQNENQNLHLQLSDMGSNRDLWASYASELENQAETDLVEHTDVKTEQEAVSGAITDADADNYQRQIDHLESDRQELINYARKLEYDVEQLSQELDRKESASRRQSQSIAPPTPSDSVNQESLIPYPSFSNEPYTGAKNPLDSTLESEGFASLFADIDQMRDEMMKLSQLNTSLQEDCRVLKTDRDRLAKEMNRLVDENSELVNERKEFLSTPRKAMGPNAGTPTGDDMGGPASANQDRLPSEDGGAVSQDLVHALLLQIHAVKAMLEADFQLLTEIQVTLSPDSAESTRNTEVLSDDSRSSAKPVDRDQITRLFTSLKTLIRNQSGLIEDVQEIIHQLQKGNPAADLFNKAPPKLQRRQSAFETRSQPAFHELSRQEVRSVRQDHQELEKLKHEKQALAQENQQFRRRLQEAHEKNSSLRQRNLMLESLEAKIRDLIQVKDDEYTMSTEKICQLEYDLQTKMNKIMALTREKNLLVQDNNELRRKLIMLNEATRQLEVDFQSEKEMSKSFQNQIRTLKDSLRLEQQDKRSKLVRLEANLAEKTEESGDPSTDQGASVRTSADLNHQIDMKSRLSRAEKEMMFLRKELRYGSPGPLSPASSQFSR
ncbi:hypothetical protein K493DRAFT_363602 [Basidiobolus meristosporus CBS 931.73]|uniref:Uncharacterized protein n=1 Tax=Basidiobolus meristosporus CBS 931.73 TaxID=1314790 RepID=A0A1Y1WTJ0_9FUNG|nr:hypothetical protein K493DRAFT_363602 [Basidiobolus meristosporus CBS 931.73]|eukprot:ORX76762.1 hypothetical protein K493DRAFT_363602 [Basidiobolus meristosporus CBS 931.73]